MLNIRHRFFLLVATLSCLVVYSQDNPFAVEETKSKNSRGLTDGKIDYGSVSFDLSVKGIGKQETVEPPQKSDLNYCGKDSINQFRCSASATPKYATDLVACRNHKSFEFNKLSGQLNKENALIQFYSPSVADTLAITKDDLQGERQKYQETNQRVEVKKQNLEEKRQRLFQLANEITYSNKVISYAAYVCADLHIKAIQAYNKIQSENSGNPQLARKLRIAYIKKNQEVQFYDGYRTVDTHARRYAELLQNEGQGKNQEPTGLVAKAGAPLQVLMSGDGEKRALEIASYNNAIVQNRIDQLEVTSLALEKKVDELAGNIASIDAKESGDTQLADGGGAIEDKVQLSDGPEVVLSEKEAAIVSATDVSNEVTYTASTSAASADNTGATVSKPGSTRIVEQKNDNGEVQLQSDKDLLSKFQMASLDRQNTKIPEKPSFWDRFKKGDQTAQYNKDVDSYVDASNKYWNQHREIRKRAELYEQALVKADSPEQKAKVKRHYQAFVNSVAEVDSNNEVVVNYNNKNASSISSRNLAGKASNNQSSAEQKDFFKELLK